MATAGASRSAQALLDGTYREFGRFGDDGITLAVGDPAISPPMQVLDAYIKAVAEGRTHYGDYWGDAELRTVLASHVGRLARRDIPLSEILMTHGASGGLTATLLAILDPGDRILIPEPTYSLYADVARMAGAVPVFVPLRPGFRLDLDRIAAESSTAKAIVVCNPNNPTGMVYTPGEMTALGGIVAESRMWMVADEAYHQLVFDDRPFCSAFSLPDVADRVIYTQTFSKTYCMTGLRIGYIVAPGSVMPSIKLVHQTMNGCLNPAVQRAALAATAVEQTWVDRLRRGYQERRDLTLEFLQDTPTAVLTPAATFYAFIDLGVDAARFIDIAVGHRVEVRAGREFGPSGANHIRICFGDPDDILIPGLERLATALRSPEFQARAASR
jgi:aspartate aminotransferase